MILFCHGNCARPIFEGRVFMMYSNVIKPGTSIVIQPILPGILKRLVVDVLPAPYHGIIHCAAVTRGKNWKR